MNGNFVLKPQGKKNFREKLSRISVTGWIVITNIFIYLLIFALSLFKITHIDYFALKPASILNGEYLWTLAIHMFTHFYFWHLFINMFVLISLGGLCEKIIGRKRFFWFYLFSGLFLEFFQLI